MAEIKGFFAGFGAGIMGTEITDRVNSKLPKTILIGLFVLSGSSQRIVSVIVSHPLDTLKVRQQTYNCGLLTAVRRTLKYEGIKGLYSGVAFPLLTWGPSNSLFFGVYEIYMKILESYNITADVHYQEKLRKDNEFLKKVFYAGCIAGLPQAVFYSPVEYIKTILQARTESKGKWKSHYVSPYTGAMEALKGIYKDSGIKGLYRGVWPMIIRDVPTSGLYVWTYEVVRYNALEGLVSSIQAKQIIAGGMAGITSLVAALPLDVVKTTIQTDNPNNPIYNGMVDCSLKLYAEYGWRIFFTGLPVLCLRAFPAHAVMFTSYSFFMSL